MAFQKLTLTIPFALMLSACQPTTVGDGLVNGWPTSDQSLSGTHLVEIEQNLRKLGIFRGRIDGQITEITRNAIARYQRSVGVRGNGVVSATLLRSLRSSVASIKPVRASTNRVSPSRQTSAPQFEGGQGNGGGNSSDGGSSGNDGGGSSGGDDGGGSSGGDDGGGSSGGDDGGGSGGGDDGGGSGGGDDDGGGGGDDGGSWG